MLYELRQFAKGITKGEILVVCIAFVVWTTLCVFINLAILNYTMKTNEVYYKAIQIDGDNELFEYAMRTNAGNALVYGTAICVDSVTDEMLKGNYLAIKVDVDKYVQKVKYEDVKDSEGNVIGQKAVYYKEWDHYKSSDVCATTINFVGVDFPYYKLSIKNFKSLTLNSSNVASEYSNKIKNNYIYPEGTFSHSVGDLRYSYSVVPISQNITILASLKDGSIYNALSNDTSVTIHYGESISRVIESRKNSENVPNIFFTIVWYILFIVFACLFVNERNKWADC